MRAPPLRAVLWQGIFWPGCEWCELAHGDDGWRIAGTVLAAVAGEPARVEYAIDLAGDWSTREVLIDYRRGLDTRHDRLRLTVDQAQRWYVERESLAGMDTAANEIAALRGLIDVDLGFSPVTNTLPIRRLDPAIGVPVDVTAAWVRFPELTLEPLPQRYIRLDERRYRYESRGGAFTAELVVDDLGLVVTYEGGWQRIAFTPFTPSITPAARRATRRAGRARRGCAPAPDGCADSVGRRCRHRAGPA